MKTIFLAVCLLSQLPDLPKGNDTINPITYGGEQGTAKIARHWWDFHKHRDGRVTIKLKQDLRAPIYRVKDISQLGADFQVLDPGYAHANHFTISGKKGHQFSWSVAGRP